MRKIFRRIKHLVLLTGLNLFQVLRLHKFFAKDPQIIHIHTAADSDAGGDLCVFASFSRSGEAAEHVFYYLEKLKESGFDIVFVTTATAISPASLSRLLSLCHKVIHRQNTGLDFGSWKAGLLYADIDLRKYRRLLLTNDSCYAPLFPLSELFGKAAGDLYGITDSFEIKYHIMSYFVLYDAKIFHSPAFITLWSDVRMVPTRLKSLIVRLYEVGMSQHYLKLGFQLQVYCAVTELIKKIDLNRPDLTKINTVHRFWKELIEQMRCPVLKVDLFWRFFAPRGDHTWEKVVAKTDYKMDLIRKHQGIE